MEMLCIETGATSLEPLNYKCEYILAQLCADLRNQTEYAVRVRILLLKANFGQRSRADLVPCEACSVRWNCTQNIGAVPRNIPLTPSVAITSATERDPSSAPE